MKITFTIEPTIAITDRSGASVTVDLAAIPGELLNDIIAQAVTHGLTQKVNDAASAALDAALPAEASEWAPAKRRQWGADNAETVAATRLAMRQAMADQLTAGAWGVTRGAATPVDPLDGHRLKVATEFMASTASAGILAAKAYKAIDPKDARARKEFKLDLVKAYPALEAMAADRLAAESAFADI